MSQTSKHILHKSLLKITDVDSVVEDSCKIIEEMNCLFAQNPLLSWLFL